MQIWEVCIAPRIYDDKSLWAARYLTPEFKRYSYCQLEMDIVLIESLLAVLIAAGIGRILSRRMRQPVILGELLMGMLLGNLALVTVTDSISNFANIGILFLLFSAGFTINLEEFKRLGKSSGIVASAGVIVPFALGYFTSLVFGFEHLTSLFVGTALAATSVGIQVAVLREVKMLRTRMGTLIIGSAVADDVISIVILAALGSLVTLGGNPMNEILLLVIGTVIFFTLSLTVGIRTIKTISRRIRVRRENLLLLALIIIFAFGLIAEEIGLEMIIGSFLAGLILGQSYFARDILEQISIFGEAFFIPIFFVTMGVGFDLHAMASLGAFAIVLVLMAIIGKLVGCSIGAKISGFNARDSLAIGIAMIPRAEMALIVSSVGLRYGIINQDIVSTIMIMVVVTTLVTPPMLKASLHRARVK